MKILKFKKISKNKYKIFLDDGNNITLYEEVIIDNNLLLKKEIEKESIDFLLEQNNAVNAYFIALNYILIRLRSKKEIDQYLIKKGINEEKIKEVVGRLERENYINDFNFAKAYANDQLVLSTSGPLKIKNNLIKLGVSKEIIDEVLEETDYNMLKEKMYNLFEKQLKIRKGNVTSVKTKILNYFLNLGYEKSDVMSLLENHHFKTDYNLLKKDFDKLFNKYKNKYDKDKLKYFISGKLYQKGYSKEEINQLYDI